MRHILISAVTAIALSSALNADELSDLKAQLKTLSERLETLEATTKKQNEQTQILTDELINVQNATSFSTIDTTKTEAGLGIAASKVYYSKNPLSIGGYGELFYSNQLGKSDTQVDSNGVQGGSNTEAYRFVPYIGYKFSDNIILNSEIEFEHGGAEISLEQLYIDFLINEKINIRLGQQVVPMGLVSLNHEPVMYNTVLRPDVETYLIPSTWHENGLSVYGSMGNFQYTAGTIVALDMGLARHDQDVSSRGIRWIADGRRGGTELNSATSNMGAVGRLDYIGINGLLAGASIYSAKAGPINDTQGKEGSITMFDVHGQYQSEGFKIKGLYTQTQLTHASSYVGNAISGFDFTGIPMPEKARGGYVNMEYNVLGFLTQSSARMPVFFQYENYNLATRMSDGNSFGTTESFTYGINYFPHDQVVLKGEYKLRNNRNSVEGHASEGIYSFGLGFIF
ncbi:MAG: porin [Sulfuricurvum sp.]|nr:porin [Sulfuricurvum sp.]